MSDSPKNGSSSQINDRTTPTPSPSSQSPSPSVPEPSSLSASTTQDITSPTASPTPGPSSVQTVGPSRDYQAPPEASTAGVVSAPPIVDRADLITKARAFLTSPQVRDEGLGAKRRFLAEKGLWGEEIESLLQEAPPPALTIPPRTYPQPPPSQLPNLLAGVARILSWVAGSSLAVLLIYFRYIYPRLDKSYQARLALRSHHQDLLGKLTESLTALKAQQGDTHTLLPCPEPFGEEPEHAACHTLENTLATSRDEGRDIPKHVLLRCVIEDLTKQERKTTTEEIFNSLEAHMRWLAESDQGASYEGDLWQTLSNSPIFHQSEMEVDGGKVIVWTYHAPAPLPLPPLLNSLDRLKAALPKPSAGGSMDGKLSLITGQSRFQHTLEALSSLTGYISAQTYAIPSLRPFGINTSLNTEEDEVRKEIRALKGLVLNRRSFMPAIPRPASASPSLA